MSKSPSEDCDFCAIARGDDRSVELVCEDTNWVAFFPLDPATPGHTLVIPRLHVEHLWRADPALASELMQAVVRVGRAIEFALQPEGMNLITSAGSAAEQTIFPYISTLSRVGDVTASVGSGRWRAGSRPPSSTTQPTAFAARVPASEVGELGRSPSAGFERS